MVGVFPADEHCSREQLFRALEAVFDVTFVARQPGEWRGVDAALVLGDAGTTVDDLRAAGVPTFSAPVDRVGRRGGHAPITFAVDAAVDARIRGRHLVEAHSPAAPLDEGGTGTVLATGPRGAVWARRRPAGVVHDEVSTPLDELLPGERLKDQVAAGRFLSLLPLVQFLRDVVEHGWERPPLRASFILDDPNLHWRSYGYLRYPELAAHAATHRYHVGIAMVPLDAVYAHPATVRLFRSSPQLSLLVHGNDHVKRELAQPLPHAQAVAMLSQALHRMAAFERRHRLRVCRVMVPPHYDCSVPMMAAMLETGFEAVCYTGPVDVVADPLGGWAPADVHLGGGLPGLHRLPFDATTDELALRAFLDQAIVLYGHHTDLAKGIDVLAAAAERVNSLGDVAWASSAAVARSSYLVRGDGATTHVRAYSRHLVVTPADGTSRLCVELPPSAGKRAETVRLVGGSGGGAVSTTGEGAGLAVRGGAPVGVELLPLADATVAPSVTATRPAWRPWPIVRRCLTETRDRVSPLLGVEWSQRQVQ